MKEIDLLTAPAGAVFITRGGEKVIGVKMVENGLSNRWFGYIVTAPGQPIGEPHYFTRKGIHVLNLFTYDLVAMEYSQNQPKVDVGVLPAPLNEAGKGDVVYYVHNSLVTSRYFDPDGWLDCALLRNGLLFNTRSDCEEWQTAMIGAKR